MIRFNKAANIDVVATSGMLRVTVHPRLHWLVGFLELAGMIIFAVYIYRSWGQLTFWFRVLLAGGLCSTVLSFLYQMSGTEVIEFDAQKLTISKGIHGWERKREHRIEDCSELEWTEGSEDTHAALKCKVGWKTVTFGEYISENEAIEILTALQRTFPDVAQKICSFPKGKAHFITLGLSR